MVIRFTEPIFFKQFWWNIFIQSLHIAYLLIRSIQIQNLDGLCSDCSIYLSKDCHDLNSKFPVSLKYICIYKSHNAGIHRYPYNALKKFLPLKGQIKKNRIIVQNNNKIFCCKWNFSENRYFKLLIPNDLIIPSIISSNNSVNVFDIAWSIENWFCLYVLMVLLPIIIYKYNIVSIHFVTLLWTFNKVRLIR